MISPIDAWSSGCCSTPAGMRSWSDCLWLAVMPYNHVTPIGILPCQLSQKVNGKASREISGVSLSHPYTLPSFAPCWTSTLPPGASPHPCAPLSPWAPSLSLHVAPLHIVYPCTPNTPSPHLPHALTPFPILVAPSSDNLACPHAPHLSLALPTSHPCAWSLTFSTSPWCPHSLSHSEAFTYLPASALASYLDLQLPAGFFTDLVVGSWQEIVSP